MKMAESYPNGLETLWEKEKLIVTSNFSISLSVFKRLVSQGRQKASLCGNGLTNLRKKTFENIVGKGENQHFLLFTQCFLPFPTDFNFLLRFILSSAITLTSGQSKILPFREELILCHTQSEFLMTLYCICCSYFG